MKYSIEQLLLATTPVESRNQAFVDSTLQAVRAIKEDSLFAKADAEHIGFRPSFGSVVLTRRTAIIVLSVLVAAFVSFSGYAYASGSNPLELIKRIIVGDSVQIDYDGRKFSHGKSLAYSDAAVSAFAELNFIQGLAFQASNAYTMPRDGYEHVSDPYHASYIYPWVGTVERVDGSMVTIHRLYIAGDKATVAQDKNDYVQISANDISSYVEGREQPLNSVVGKTVVVNQYAYVKHKIGSNESPQSIVHAFIFVSQHSLQDIKQANQGTGRKDDKPDAEHGIFETDWGDVSTICLNNGADRCSINKLKLDSGESLYVSSSGSTTNPHVEAIGEGLPENTPSNGQIMRAVEGKITEITASGFTVKTSSGQLWHLAYDSLLQNDFATRTSALKIGNTVSGTVIGSVHELNNRMIDAAHIYDLRRI